MNQKVKSIAVRLAAPATLLITLLSAGAAHAQVSEDVTQIGNATLVPLNNGAHTLLYNFGVPILLFVFAVGIAIAWAFRAKRAAKGRG